MKTKRKSTMGKIYSEKEKSIMKQPKKSQSISSDTISESTIARMAGNILSGVTDLIEGTDNVVYDAVCFQDDARIARAVALARGIAQQVVRTCPVEKKGQKWPLHEKKSPR
jgi:hypothetical protein